MGHEASRGAKLLSLSKTRWREMKHPEMLPKSRFASVASHCRFTQSDFSSSSPGRSPVSSSPQWKWNEFGWKVPFFGSLLLFALNRSNMGRRISLLLWHFSFFFLSFHVDIRSMIFSYSICVCHQQKHHSSRSPHSTHDR